jgi:hypothetical protein
MFVFCEREATMIGDNTHNGITGNIVDNLTALYSLQGIPQVFHPVLKTSCHTSANFLTQAYLSIKFCACVYDVFHFINFCGSLPYTLSFPEERSSYALSPVTVGAYPSLWEIFIQETTVCTASRLVGSRTDSHPAARENKSMDSTCASVYILLGYPMSLNYFSVLIE